MAEHAALGGRAKRRTTFGDRRVGDDTLARRNPDSYPSCANPGEFYDHYGEPETMPEPDAEERYAGYVKQKRREA